MRWIIPALRFCWVVLRRQTSADRGPVEREAGVKQWHWLFLNKNQAGRPVGRWRPASPSVGDTFVAGSLTLRSGRMSVALSAFGGMALLCCTCRARATPLCSTILC